VDGGWVCVTIALQRSTQMKDSNRGDKVYGDNALKAQDDIWVESEFEPEDPSSWDILADSESSSDGFEVICDSRF